MALATVRRLAAYVAGASTHDGVLPLDDGVTPSDMPCRSRPAVPAGTPRHEVLATVRSVNCLGGDQMVGIPTGVPGEEGVDDSRQGTPGALSQALFVVLVALRHDDSDTRRMAVV